MFSFFSKKPFYNKKFNDYCMQTTMETIRQITQNYKTNLLLKYNNKHKLLTNSHDNPHDNPNNPINIFIVLSVSTLLYYFLGSFRATRILNADFISKKIRALPFG